MVVGELDEPNLNEEGACGCPADAAGFEDGALNVKAELPVPAKFAPNFLRSWLEHRNYEGD